jgi:hypothetical protein
MKGNKNKFTDMESYDDLFKIAKSLGLINSKNNPWKAIRKTIVHMILSNDNKKPQFFTSEINATKEMISNALYKNIRKTYIKCVDVNLISAADIRIAEFWRCFSWRNGDINPLFCDMKEYAAYMSEFLFNYLHEGGIDLDDDNIMFQKMLLYFAIYYEGKHPNMIDRKEIMLELTKKKYGQQICTEGA